MASVKFVHNCEAALFQRPDEAIHRGYDKRTERDFSRPGNFFSNYEPLHARCRARDHRGRDRFRCIHRAGAENRSRSSSRRITRRISPPRRIPASSTASRRRIRVTCKSARTSRIRAPPTSPRWARGSIGASRLARRRCFPWAPCSRAAVSIRPSPACKPMCVFGPVHYQELPEAFMDFIASLTGKSPSTTGAGSEGALTKGPFNALPPIHDLNAALVSYVLTGLPVFSSAAGWVGPRCRVDHDISLLVPEIWARMTPEERTPRYLIENGYLERCVDWDHEGKPRAREPARLAGHRRASSKPSAAACSATRARCSTRSCCGRSCRTAPCSPRAWTTSSQAMRTAAAMLLCRRLDRARRVRRLHALLHIMRDGTWEGAARRRSDVPRAVRPRDRCSRATGITPGSRRSRQRDVAQWEQRALYLEKFLARPNYADLAAQLGVRERLAATRAAATAARQPDYMTQLVGTLGVDPALVP